MHIRLPQCREFTTTDGGYPLMDGASGPWYPPIRKMPKATGHPTSEYKQPGRVSTLASAQVDVDRACARTPTGAILMTAATRGGKALRIENPSPQSASAFISPGYVGLCISAPHPNRTWRADAAMGG